MNSVRGVDINRSYYNSSQPGRDDYWEKMAAPRFRTETFIKLLEGMGEARLVDLGCGDGRFLRVLQDQRRPWTLCGIDLSDSQIELNKRTMPAMEWFAADLGAEKLSIDPDWKTFDAVIASEIIEHVEDPVRFLSNARALANPHGGRLYLSTQSGRIGETERRVGHIRHFSKREMVELLNQAGWKPIRVWTCGFPFHDAAKWAANLSPNSAMRHFSERPYGTWQTLLCALLRLAYRFNSSTRGSQLFAVAERFGPQQ
ncbi:MAG: class I SAM-dependent methyltransferase [Elusimicrobia bacterium]|nr:class I SAM-dependent methyltransferase [Elusimicrobiota bacterium]